MICAGLDCLFDLGYCCLIKGLRVFSLSSGLLEGLFLLVCLCLWCLWVSLVACLLLFGWFGWCLMLILVILAV